MKNKQGQVFAIVLLAAFLFILMAFITIEPFKETLNVIRDKDNLNCRDVSNFNITEYDEQTDYQKLVKRGPCFVTGLTMVWFVGAFVIAVFVWTTRNIFKLTKK